MTNKMKITYRLIVFGLCIFMLTGCAKGAQEDISPTGMGIAVPEEYYENIEEAATAVRIEDNSKKYAGDGSNIEEGSEEDISPTGMGIAVPEEYYEIIEEAGTVVRIEYNSKKYAGDGSDIVKEAYVYLPYGYDANDTETRYDICYLMHGLEGFAGEFFEKWSMKQMLDHMFLNGDINQMILVSATFYYEGCEQDYDTSVEEVKAFYQDFENHLMPAIESQFNTYAVSTSKEDLVASRDHRAFGGFSLGAYTTWMQFCYNSDYIKYYLPISGASWYYGGRDDFQTEKNVDYLEEVVEKNNLDEKGYFIYYAVGTEDEIKSQTTTQAEEMLRRRNVFTKEHFVYYQMEGGEHDRRAERDFMYNALPTFFK